VETRRSKYKKERAQWPKPSIYYLLINIKKALEEREMTDVVITING
jgi:hypothetical protein